MTFKRWLLIIALVIVVLILALNLYTAWLVRDYDYSRSVPLRFPELQVVPRPYPKFTVYNL